MFNASNIGFPDGTKLSSPKQKTVTSTVRAKVWSYGSYPIPLS